MSLSTRTLGLMGLAMVAFAANSVLGRMGLIETNIGAGSFALIRLCSGALMLAALVLLQKRSLTGSWISGGALLIYAGFFSYAYLALPAGTGAIILFGVVQITMLGWGLKQGEAFGPAQVLGLVLAMSGLVWLVSPSVETPPLFGSIAMMISGIGWGIYSLLGQGSGDPVAATAGNFARASVFAILLAIPVLAARPEPIPEINGILFAVASGIVTSGLGYVIWYAALRDLKATQAGIAQLSVPAIAAIGGVIFLSEPITLRFTLASSIILLGVALGILTKTAHSRKAGE